MCLRRHIHRLLELPSKVPCTVKVPVKMEQTRCSTLISLAMSCASFVGHRRCVGGSARAAMIQGGVTKKKRILKLLALSIRSRDPFFSVRIGDDGDGDGEGPFRIFNEQKPTPVNFL